MGAGGRAPGIGRAAGGTRGDDSFRLFPRGGVREAFAQWAVRTPDGLDDAIADRERVLEGLIKAGATSIPAVNEAILAYQAETLGISVPATQGEDASG